MDDTAPPAQHRPSMGRPMVRLIGRIAGDGEVTLDPRWTPNPKPAELEGEDDGRAQS